MMHNDFKQVSIDMERLKEEVLSRVRTVRRIRAFFKSPMSSASLVVILLLCASILVSFGDIVHNIMAQGAWQGRFSYTYISLLHARMAVQVLAGLTSLSFLVLFAKILFRLRTPVSSVGNFIANRISFRLFKS